jgi:hypothetical protein
VKISASTPAIGIDQINAFIYSMHPFIITIMIYLTLSRPLINQSHTMCGINAQSAPVSSWKIANLQTIAKNTGAVWEHFLSDSPITTIVFVNPKE